MHKLVKHSMLVLLAVMLICASLAPPASAQVEVEKRPPGGAAMAYDLVLLRPLGLVATVGGTAVFVVSLPFSLLGGNVGQASKALVADPLTFTFVRPIGFIPFSYK